jgi:hypothetical protein
MLARVGQLPPAPCFRVSCHGGHVGFVVGAHIFEVAEQEAVPQEDRVVGDVDLAEHGQHPWPYIGVQGAVVGLRSGRSRMTLAMRCTFSSGSVMISTPAEAPDGQDLERSQLHFEPPGRTSLESLALQRTLKQVHDPSADEARLDEQLRVCAAAAVLIELTTTSPDRSSAALTASTRTPSPSRWMSGPTGCAPRTIRTPRFVS